MIITLIPVAVPGERAFRVQKCKWHRRLTILVASSLWIHDINMYGGVAQDSVPKIQFRFSSLLTQQQHNNVFRHLKVVSHHQ